MMTAITNLGDSALLLPASLAVLGLLVWRGDGRAAVAWTIAVSACLVLTVLAKLGFGACGSGTGFALESPSGHTSFAATLYGSGALLAAMERPRWQRIAILGAAVLLVGLVGVSRVVGGAHSPEEVLVGLLIGTACVLLFYRQRLPSRPARVPLGPVVASFVAVAVLLDGQHLSAEPLIRQIAHEIANFADLPECGKRPAPSGRASHMEPARLRGHHQDE